MAVGQFARMNMDMGRLCADVDAGVIEALRDNGAANVTAETFRVGSKDAYEIEIHVSDMMPPFRRTLIEVSGYMARTSIEAFAIPLREVVGFIGREREVRRWSHVDP